tara:strand:+ start:1346 stop:1972 length:627 start_codon:yes stop_codon:yes gene_type:complete
MKLPTEQEVQDLIASFRVPTHILKHMQKVNEVTLFLARKLNEHGENYNLKLLDFGARLHDLAKPLSFKEIQVNKKENLVPQERNTKEDLEFWFDKKKEFSTPRHGEIAGEVLKDYPELAKMISNHGPQDILKENLTKEILLLNYVDKRICEEEIVTIGERFAGFRKSYSESNDSEEIINKFLKIEQDIFTKIGLKPEDLKLELEKDKK